MKRIQYFILAIIFASSIIEVEGAAYTCATHPIFLMASTYFTKVVDGDLEGGSRIAELIAAFTANTPAVLTEDDLGFCSQFAGEQTCCTKKMIEIFDAAAVYSVAGMQINGTAVNKLTYVLQKVLDVNMCGSPASGLSIEDFLENPALTKFKAYYNAGQSAKKEFSKVIAGLNRGSLCSVCAGIDKVDQYLISSILQLSLENINDFIIALYESFNILYSAINNQTLYHEALDELLAAFIGSCDGIIDQIKTDIVFIYGIQNANPRDSDGNLKCNGKAIFSDRPVCDAAQDGDSQVIPEADAYGQVAARLLRNLADTNDGEIVVSNGLMVFIPNDTDEIINADGDYNVTWPASMINNNSGEGNNTNNNSNNNSGNSSNSNNSNNSNNNDSNNNSTNSNNNYGNDGYNNNISNNNSASRICFAAIAVLFAALSL